MGVFQRFHACYVGRTGAPVGVFVAVDHLRRTGRLSEEEIVHYAFVDGQRSFSADPGEVVYEDRWQVGVVPSVKFAMTPLPYPGTMGPSDWFEVRKGILAKHRLWNRPLPRISRSQP
jgi:hypothetical protein